VDEKVPSELHKPVMLKEVLDGLNPQPGQWAVDCTVGAGGHARAILEQMGSQGHLIAMDWDPWALEISRENLSSFGDQVVFVQENFRNIRRILMKLDKVKVNMILVDCGVSSMQLDNPKRGFSFQHTGPLDMRMNPSIEPLLRILKRTNETELGKILAAWGQERYARRIARAIKTYLRSSKSPDTTSLAQTIRRAVPYSYERGRIHPATRTFQALRIRVNDELKSLETGVRAGLNCLVDGGRMAVLSFHSLEDRIVKTEFRSAEESGQGRRLNKKVIFASGPETSCNPRSRSARLRVFERKQAA